jgi:hypothetical protein
MIYDIPLTIDMAMGHLWGTGRTGPFIHDVSGHLNGDVQHKISLGSALIRGEGLNAEISRYGN